MFFCQRLILFQKLSITRENVLVNKCVYFPSSVYSAPIEMRILWLSSSFCTYTFTYKNSRPCPLCQRPFSAPSQSPRKFCCCLQCFDLVCLINIEVTHNRGMRFRTDKQPKFKAESDTKHKNHGVACTPITELKLCSNVCSTLWCFRDCLFCGNNIVVTMCFV